MSIYLVMQKVAEHLTFLERVVPYLKSSCDSFNVINQK